MQYQKRIKSLINGEELDVYETYGMGDMKIYTVLKDGRLSFVLAKNYIEVNNDVK